MEVIFISSKCKKLIIVSSDFSLTVVQLPDLHRHRTVFGDRAFSVAGPKIWNDPPPELRHMDIGFGQFRNMLKSYLFRF